MARTAAEAYVDAVAALWDKALEEEGKNENKKVDQQILTWRRGRRAGTGH